MLALVVALTLGQLSAADRTLPNPLGPFFTNPATMGSAGELFRAFSVNGAGVAYSDASTFCSDFAFTVASSSYMCFEGDGDRAFAPNGGWDATTVNVTSNTRRVCPNGPDCGSLTGYKLGTGSAAYIGQAGTSGATPNGDFSVYALVRYDSFASSPTIAAKYVGTTTTPTFQFFISSTGGITFEVYKSAGGVSGTDYASTGAPSGSVTPGALHFIVATYDFITSGTSQARIYVDGVQVGASNAMLGPPMSNALGIRWGQNNGGGQQASGVIYLAGFTDVRAFSQSEVTAMSDGLIPERAGAKGTRGESITTARASIATCTAPADADGDGAFDLSVLPANRPCITCLGGSCGTYVEATSANLGAQPQYNAINAAPWVGVGNGAVQPTLNGADTTATTAPDGTFTAEDYSFAATAAGQDSMRALNTTNACAPSISCVFSIYVKGVAGVSDTGTIDVCGYGTATAGCAPCSYTSTAWTRCSKPFTTGGTDTMAGVAIGNSTKWNGGTTRPSQRLYVWGSQQENNGTSLPTTLIPATTATVTRAGVTPAVPKPAAMSTSEGCALATVTPIWTGAAPVETRFIVGQDTTDLILYANASGTTIRSYNGTAATTAAANFTANTPHTYRAQWSVAGNALTTSDLTTGATSTVTFAGFPAFNANINIGASSVGTQQPIGAIIGNVVLGNSAAGCLR
jgi:hypothetical protein